MSTEKTVENFDKEVVYKAVEVALVKLLEQGAKSEEVKTGFCKYRGDEGRCCLIGFMIKDDQYKKSFEGLTASEDGITEAVIESLGFTSTLPSEVYDEMGHFLGIMQSLHDTTIKAGVDIFESKQEFRSIFFKRIKRKVGADPEYARYVTVVENWLTEHGEL